MLGDSISFALASVGVTQQRVSNWLGRPCRCPEYIEKLNQLDSWARRIVKGQTDKAVEYLNQLIGAEHGNTDF